MDELLDIVNAQDHVIAQKWRSEVYAHREKYIIRGVWLFIVNDKGQLWIPRRVATKKIAPLALDGSAVGHVSAGETYRESLQREVQEELNIDLVRGDCKEIAYLTPQLLGDAFVKVYQLSMNQAPKYNPEDFCEYFWLTPQELLEKINKGDLAKDSLSIIVKHIYGI